MENIISSVGVGGGPGGGYFAHYLALDVAEGSYGLSVLQDYFDFEDGGVSREDIASDDYSVFDPDGELGEGACWSGREIVGWDEDGFLQLDGYMSARSPQNYDNAPDDIAFTDPSDPQLSVILNYFSMSVEELKKECEELEADGDAGQADQESYGLIGSARHGDVEAVKRHLVPPVGSNQEVLDTAFFLAAWRNDLEILKLLIAAGADVKAVFWNDYLEEETSALIVAGRVASKLLLEAGARERV